jgi:hypothetical protein
MPFTRSIAGLTLVSTVALGGCTITTYGNEPVPPPPQQQAQAQAPQPATPARTRRAKPAVTNPTKTPVDNDVTPRMTSANAFGRSVSSALAAHAFVIPEGTTSIPNLSSMVPFARFWADNIAVAPQEFSGGFPGALQQEEWFAVRYEGKFEVPSDATWEFKLGSDDGAVLWVDGKKVVDNDGAHQYKEATGKTDLKAGPHRLRVEYFQAKKGTVALQLWIVENGKDKLVTGVR